MKPNTVELEPNEQMLLRVRKHWFILCTQILMIILLAVLPAILATVLATYIPKLAPLIEMYVGFVIALYAAWLLILWMFLFSMWTNYYLDVWTITNKRIIAVDQKGFFFRTTATFRLERLQDIIVSVDGVLPTLLDFGALEIQTAGVEKNFKGYGLPKPGSIKAIIMNSTDILFSKEPVRAESAT